jgi:hypothetical protein
MVACIGWDSLIWDKRKLDVYGGGGRTRPEVLNTTIGSNRKSILN